MQGAGCNIGVHSGRENVRRKIVMRKARKGFTLIELLIVITIMASLSAMMAITSGNATARAKTSSIVANVEACKTAAAVYYSDNWDATGIATSTAKTFLEDTTKYIPNFGDFSTGNIVFTALSDTTNQGRDNWAIKVTFKDEAEADNISRMLAKAKGYSGMYTAGTPAVEDDSSTTDVDESKEAVPEACKHTFTVNLTTGVITATNDDD